MTGSSTTVPEPRDPADDVDGRDQCYLHGYEPTTARTYVVCGECGHAFEAQELLDATAAILAEVRAHDVEYAATHPGFAPLPGPDAYAPPTDPTDVRVCPLCTHDL